jgi:hypothetical protein
LAKPNYSFEKRQRELAKKRKKEDKAARKSAGGGSEELNPNEAAMALPPAVEIDPPAEDAAPAPAPSSDR